MGKQTVPQYVSYCIYSFHFARTFGSHLYFYETSRGKKMKIIVDLYNLCDENLQAFLKAWEAACDYTGSSTFYIPEGKFLLGPITFSGPCYKNQSPDVQIRGTLLAVPDLSAYPADDWIVFDNLQGFNLIGDPDEPTLDGQGGLDAWKQESCVQSANCNRLITVSLSSVIVFKGTELNNW